MKGEVRIWKIPGWLLRHFKKAQGLSSPQKTVVYLGLLFSGIEVFLLVLNLFASSFGLAIVTVASVIVLGTILTVSIVMYFFRIIIVRKECHDCQFGFYIVAHEINHLKLNSLDEDMVERETQKQTGSRFFPLILSNPVLCKDRVFRRKKYRAAAEEYVKSKFNA
jgi:hypothetical protein